MFVVGGGVGVDEPEAFRGSVLAEESKRGARRDQLHGEEPTELG